MQAQKILADRYELVRHLARGGMADVYEAEDLLLGRRVAVKILHSQLASDDAFVRRFRREAQAAANLSHPNIVGIFDWGQDEEGIYFIVMELVRGRTLRDVLRGEGPLLPRRAAELAAEVASALAVAHRSGLVHRDIKPGNILLTPDGDVKVTDFGIARAWDDSSELTKTGAVIGTASYFSPEQAQGHPSDERSDLYALGVVLYEMLTGHPPFSGETPVAVAYQHVSAAPPTPSSESPDIPPQLDAIVMRALEKSPQRRYQSAEELREDLLRILQAQPVGVPDDGAPTRMMTIPPPTVPPDETYRQMAEEGPGSQRLFVLTVVGLLLALGLGLFVLTRLLAGAGSPGAELVEIPDLAGQPQAEALVTLQGIGLRVRTAQEPSEDFAEGLVTRTDPPAGEMVEPDSFVTVFVSAGPEAFPVPNLEGLLLDEARRLVEQNGFQVGAVTEEPSDEIGEGRVIRQSPTASTMASPGTTVDLVVSTGPEVVELPDLAGRSERDALFLLGRLDLDPTVVEEFSEEVAEGFVIRTEPGPGTEMRSGDPVTLVVSRGPRPIEVPDLIGDTEEEARNRLEDLGLHLEVLEPVTVTDPDQEGRVQEQSPDAGTEVQRGATVRVRLGELPDEPPDDDD